MTFSVKFFKRKSLVMKKIYILNILAALILSVAADVPALINYQGRLVDGVGNPVTGSKAFKLDIYDSQTEGTLIYQETLPDITLDEDGAYSFQFGAGVSRTGTSQLIATGDGETMLFQTRLEQTPFGPITVTDGTNTFTQGDVPTGEEPFTFIYARGLNRINLVCNEPPAEGVKFTATYRYNEGGIVGALGTAAEHWMEVTIGGEKQEPRQRLVAVPFALRAGVAERTESSSELKSYYQMGKLDRLEDRLVSLKPQIKTIKRIRAKRFSYDNSFVTLVKAPKDNFIFPNKSSDIDTMEVIFSKSNQSSVVPSSGVVDWKNLELALDHENNYYFIFQQTTQGGPYTLQSLELFYTES